MAIKLPSIYLPASAHCITRVESGLGNIGLAFKTVDGVVHRFALSFDEAAQMAESVFNSLSAAIPTDQRGDQPSVVNPSRPSQ